MGDHQTSNFQQIDDCNLNNTSSLMDEAICSLTSVCTNLKGVLGDILQPPDHSIITPELDRLEHSLNTLHTNIEDFAGPYITTARKEMVSTLEELEAIRTKYRNLQREWENQQEHIGRVQGDMFKLRAQLKNQSAFCTSLGAIMGTLMWKTSRQPKVIEELLNTVITFIALEYLQLNKVTELMCIISGSLDSFLETYHDSLPDVSTNEMQFILALVGIVANTAATTEGRTFLTTDPNGRELVSKLINILPNVPTPSGDCLKRVVLMTLYNTSINQLGLIMLLNKPSLYKELQKDIVEDNNPELRLLALRLLQSITMQIPSTRAYRDIADTIPQDKIIELTNTTDADMRLLAKSIVTSLQQARVKFDDEKKPMSAADYNKCQRKLGTNKSSCSLISF